MKRNLKTINGDIEKDVFVFQNELPSGDSTLSFSYDIQSIKDEAPYHWGEGIDHSDSDRPSYHDRIRKFWKDTGDDLKSIRWRHILGRIFTHIIVLSCIGMLAWFIFQLSMPQPALSSTCTPDGTFNIKPYLEEFGYPGTYKWWQGNSVFAIDLAFGDMEFATAKSVDILWDVGFGRGIQGILTVISYIVCTKALSRLMERTPVTLRTFEAVSLQNDTFPALCKLGREMLSRQSLRTWFILGWIAANTVMLLTFQTLSSAMTGYTAKVSAYIQIPTGERIPANKFEAVQYIIHDGHRLGDGFFDGYPVILPITGDPHIRAYEMSAYNLSAPSLQNETDHTYYWLGNECLQFQPMRRDALGRRIDGWVPYTNSMDLAVYEACQLMWHISEYTSIYGFLGLNNSASALNTSTSNISLSAPTLNISAHFATSYAVPSNSPWGSLPYGYYWKDSKGAQPFHKIDPLWAYSSTLMNATMLNSFGTCQQADVSNIRYQWGFSTLLLLVFLGMMFVWSVGTYSMWMDAYFNSALDVSQRNIGLKRAVLDVHTTMARDLSSINTDGLGNKKLGKLVKNNRLDYTDLADSETTRSVRVGAWWRNLNLKQWFRDEIVWLTLLAFFAALIPVSVMTEMIHWWLYPAAPLPVVGILLVIIIGRAHRSRWIWFMLFFLLFWGFNGWFLYVEHRPRRRRW